MLKQVFLCFILICLCISLIPQLFQVDHGCLVTGSINFNGYYISKDGTYDFIRSENSLHQIPELFELSKFPLAKVMNGKDVQIIHQFYDIKTHKYTYGFLNQDRLLLTSFSNEKHREIPPEDGWTIGPDLKLSDEQENEEIISKLKVSHCSIVEKEEPSQRISSLREKGGGGKGIPIGGRGGWSQTSNSLTNNYKNGGLFMLLKHPTTCLLLFLNLGFSWYLRLYNIKSENVCSSYQNVIRDGEIWRMFTSSFAHYDLMHVLLNMSSLWNFSSIEEHLGSLSYLCISLTLVPLTLSVTMLLYHVIITKFNREDLARTGGVGYSCVLFAWMTFQANHSVGRSHQNDFCPLGAAMICFRTFIPFSSLPFLTFNFGPFFLLIITSCILPRASFMGHLSGILIGFPLSWNMLISFITPIEMFALLLLVISFSNHFVLFPIHLTSSSSSSNISVNLNKNVSFYKQIFLLIIIISPSMILLVLLFINHYHNVLPSLCMFISHFLLMILGLHCYCFIIFLKKKEINQQQHQNNMSLSHSSCSLRSNIKEQEEQLQIITKLLTSYLLMSLIMIILNSYYFILISIRAPYLHGLLLSSSSSSLTSSSTSSLFTFFSFDSISVSLMILFFIILLQCIGFIISFHYLQSLQTLSWIPPPTSLTMTSSSNFVAFEGGGRRLSSSTHIQEKKSETTSKISSDSSQIKTDLV